MTNRDRRRGALRRRIDELHRRTTAAVEALRALDDQPGDAPLLFLLDSTRPDEESLRRALAAAFRSPADAAEIPRIVTRVLGAVLRLLPEGVIIAEAPSGGLVISNERASQIWGHRPIAAANIGEYAAYKGFHPNGRPYAPEEWPLARAILHGEVVDQEEIRFERGDGGAGWMTVSAAPVRNDSEQIIAGISTFLDVTERRQTVEAKDEFIAVLAHELRNPLAPIRTAVGILRSHDLQDPIIDRCRQVIDRQVRHMVRLLDDLLDVTRLSRGTLSLRRVPVDLHACLEGAIEMARPLVEAAHHTLSLSGTDDRIALEADEARVTQIFANLLINAAKYTPRGGHIRVNVHREDSHVSVHVQDTGVGIPASMLASVFDMFHQMTPAMDRATSGLGVGLALTRRLVEMHGGTIQARSEGTGRGSEFIVRLPTMAAAEGVPPQPTSQADSERVPTAHRVLVIDDNRDAADTSAELLAALGCLVATAYDGASALEAAGRVVPDIVLLDLGMPGMNGLEVCRRMRQEPWGSGVFIIALTGWGDARDRQATTEACFDDHLVKPVDPDQLAHVIRTRGRSRPPANSVGVPPPARPRNGSQGE